MEQVNSPASFSLAKAIHNTYASIEYLKDTIRQEQLTHNAKSFINDLINKQEYVLKSLYTRMSSEGATKLRKEMEERDIYAIDSIMNLSIKMTDEQRQELESYAEQILKNNS